MKFVFKRTDDHDYGFIKIKEGNKMALVSIGENRIPFIDSCEDNRIFGIIRVNLLMSEGKCPYETAKTLIPDLNNDSTFEAMNFIHSISGDTGYEIESIVAMLNCLGGTWKYDCTYLDEGKAIIYREDYQETAKEILKKFNGEGVWWFEQNITRSCVWTPEGVIDDQIKYIMNDFPHTEADEFEFVIGGC